MWIMRMWMAIVFVLAGVWNTCVAEPAGTVLTAQNEADLDSMVGQPVDIAPSAYQYRADRKPDENPPESWFGLIQYAGLPYTKPVDVNAPSLKRVLCELLWEDVRPVRRVQLSWPADAKNRPSPDDLALSYFDSSDRYAHTWWSPRTVREAGKPEVSADGRTYTYVMPMETWGVIVAVRGDTDASTFTVPTIQAFVQDVWKKMDIEIEWGIDNAKAALAYDGHIEAYDGIIVPGAFGEGGAEGVIEARDHLQIPLKL